jgi:hypothetical protein
VGDPVVVALVEDVLEPVVLPVVILPASSLGSVSSTAQPRQRADKARKLVVFMMDVGPGGPWRW